MGKPSKVTFLLLLSFLASCSPQKRLERLLKKHPELANNVWTEIVQNDTIIHTDTFTIQGDSIEVPYEVLKVDTVFKQGRIILQSKAGKISAFTKPDTFIKTDTTVYIKTIRVPQKVISRPWKLWEYFVFWLPAILLTVIFYNRVRK